ncbi:hypothetical protein FQA39_LY15648 [Lamprigera yunnana]|nr:hypothetical protein FQA39_LY15648 [Lamprigera yunnana]
MAAHFPMKRVRKIMKSSAEVENISKESMVVVIGAAELFVKLLVKEAHMDAKKNKLLEYKNIANIVNDYDQYEFLREMIPHKITMEKYYQIINENPKQDSDVEEANETSENETEHENSGFKEHDNSSGSESDVIMLD